MRAITYGRFGPARDVLKLEDVPTPTPLPGEVLVRLQVSGVNPSDNRARAGGRPGVTEPPFPKIIPHSDGSGIVEAVGEGVSSTRIGERVWIWNGQWQRAFGTAAEYIALPQEQAVALPDDVSFEEGAILGIPGMTACHAVLGGGPVRDRIVLVSGGAGTVGRLAIQVATASGARVLATARGDSGMEAARTAGAEKVFDYSDDTLAEQILDWTDGRPVDRIVEVEFGRNVETNTRIIAERGTIAAYGSAQEMTPVLPFYPLMFKAVTIDLVLVYLLSREERTVTVDNLTGLLERRALDFRISEVLRLEECARAHDIVAEGARAGSVLLKI
ncbi:MAG: NADPH:quinone reductase [Roseibium sp.]|uniref:NADPH:quinone reductase n=1 Tax=Roseibium sp. TaxID=1936156 RepID=UPI001B1C3E60|nr:NADPH:quinone reductase [Roseibium sp.]MBO6895334.1 NADPH:quinone reductase [Roseibium sp.]MBO6932108.1 NADPH:quinone reductase [Roseibium sp.]